MDEIAVIIVDDEKEAREGVALLLEKDKEINVKALCKNGLEAIKAVQEHQPELMFLDIQMPSINGFEVLSSLSEANLPEVIFITAFDQYSLKAFENHAVDYLLKPFTDDRFFKALEFAKKRIYANRKNKENSNLTGLLGDIKEKATNNSPQQIVPEGGSNNKIINNRLVIKADGKIYFVDLSQIIWVQAYDYYVKIHVKERFYLVRESMKKMEQFLPSEQFIRVHKSSIINLHHVVELEPYFNNEFVATMSNGGKIKTSRNYRDNLSGIL
ncbi:LytR/AlgR family response regulator transcription factor [Chondrinema litorale]|uniref:LytR/AlgR family response regulator transcription factor n=1 Tax=Chondrinema litorale TaxID=2994555 RepID=UPI002543171A|nr:LytTR family DNA-binding domain-containing protein [Chondrinema litorale]UZR98640.1 LytTR family DNA-binding domain-containing protein [Chondrinema litorale]